MKAFDLKKYFPDKKNVFDKPEDYPVTILIKKEKAEYSAANQFKSLNEILLNWKDVIMNNNFINKYVQLFNQNNSSSL